MDTTKLYPSELFFVAILNELIQKDARQQIQSAGDVQLTSQLIFCFLADKIVNHRAPNYDHVDHIVKDLESYLHSESLFVSQILKRLTFKSLDELIDYIDILDSIFEIPTNLSPNATQAPTMICKHSMLGYFTRYFLARWNAMSFEAVTAFYDLHMQFIGPTKSKFVGDFMRSTNFMGEVEKATVTGDMMAAEDAIHKLFDSSGTIPLPIQTKVATGGFPSFETSIHRNAAVASSLQSLGSKGPFLSHNRHQQAMMILATVWSRNQRHGLALSAVEEAMKTAHQRGDHAAVAKALLLLYHTINSSRSGSQQLEFQLSGDEVLQRCLERCSDSKLHLISAQAAILLAQLRGKAALRGYSSQSCSASAFRKVIDGGDGEATDRAGGDESDVAAISSVRAVWALLLSSQFGDNSLNCLTAKGSLQQEGPTAKIASAKTTLDTSVFRASQSGIVALSAASAAVGFWSRLGVGSLAELQCRRVLRHAVCMAAIGSQAEPVVGIDWEELASVCCKLAKLVVDNAFPLCANEPALSNYRDLRIRQSIIETEFGSGIGRSGNIQVTAVTEAECINSYACSHPAESACSSGLRLIKLTSRALRRRLSPAGRTALDSTRHYVLVRMALAQDSISQAVEHAESLLELTKPLDSSQAFSYNDRSQDSSSANDRSWSRQEWWSPPAAQAALVAALTMARYDPAGAARSLADLAACSSPPEVLQETLMARVLKACLLIRVELAAMPSTDSVGGELVGGGGGGGGGGGRPWSLKDRERDRDGLDSCSLQARLAMIELQEAVSASRVACFPAVEAFAHGSLAEWTFANRR